MNILDFILSLFNKSVAPPALASSVVQPIIVKPLMPNKIIKSTHCPWSVEVDGDDLVVRNILATAFGGKYDSGDSGETESGVKNDGLDPSLMGIALPIRSTEKATAESPLAFKGPHIPWLTKVLVWKESKGESTAISTVLIDNGPNVLLFPSHGLDLNPNVAAKFAPNIDPKKIANQFSMSGMSYRIIGGAKYVS